eukprot:365864-Chlamydomonas_euryale.AAC.6
MKSAVGMATTSVVPSVAFQLGPAMIRPPQKNTSFPSHASYTRMRFTGGACADGASRRTAVPPSTPLPPRASSTSMFACAAGTAWRPPSAMRPRPSLGREGGAAAVVNRRAGAKRTLEEDYGAGGAEGGREGSGVLCSGRCRAPGYLLASGGRRRLRSVRGHRCWGATAGS